MRKYGGAEHGCRLKKDLFPVDKHPCELAVLVRLGIGGLDSHGRCWATTRVGRRDHVCESVYASVPYGRIKQGKLHQKSFFRVPKKLDTRR